MKYSELIHFEPIETIVQLRATSQLDYAYNLLETYVISERMAEIIDEVVMEQLQYTRAADNKGLLVVGNYGTGKSHLMSVIATISENQGASAKINNSRVAAKAKEIEGTFKVIRSEIGATTMSLRDFICGELMDGLADMGVSFAFPPMDQVRTNKDAFAAMMGQFHETYPDKGLLLVVDELLDYLRSRNGQEVILDLGFLRELGEICRFTRFRFMAGVQEMLFDNPKFQFVADQLRRVKERFEQVSIVREDIAYVVSQRLLKKDARQKSLIRQHLQQFTLLYEKLGERLDEYVDLFPIHPAYLSTFERVIVAEKRVILKTISAEMKKLLQQDVPVGSPGVISYDNYWQYIENDPSLRTNPDIRDVMKVAKILQDKVQNSFTKPAYKPVAIRIVSALAVNRLTTGDIYTKLGVSAEELRDTLFLYAPLPEPDAEFLRTTIEAALKEIMKTVSWQYISFNEANGQYYIDINKVVPVDDLIEQKAETLTGDQLDRYYFEVLEQLTERAKNTYVTGYRIWSYELPWWERKVTRQGYLFFGAPNDRSTAQPPRDFYIYMLQLFEASKFKDELRSDEVFFRLKVADDTFVQSLRRYAGSRELAVTYTAGVKKSFEDKAVEYLQVLTRWLRHNFLSSFEVTYKGVNKKITDWTKALPAQSSVKEIIDTVAAACLASGFGEKYPDYPHFSKLTTVMSRENMPGYIQEALRYLNGAKNKSGTAVLDGFVMLEDDNITVTNSGYAKWIIKLLDGKGQGQVVNRNEIIETIFTMQGTQDVELTREFRIEPELFAVVLVALVYNGNIVLTINGSQYDAMKLDQLVKLPPSDIINFSHLKRPTGLPLPELKALFELLSLPPSYLQEHNLVMGVTQLNVRANQLLTDVVTILQTVKSGIPCWDGAVLSAAEQQQYSEALVGFKSFLEALLVFNAPAKLTNFRFSIDAINSHRSAIIVGQTVKSLQQKVTELLPLAQYVMNAGQHLPATHRWQEDSQIVLEDLLDALKQRNTCQTEIVSVLTLKKDYHKIYQEHHAKARLNAADDNRKNTLLHDARFAALKQLSNIDLLPKGHFEQLVKSITALKTCWSLTPADLENYSICPHCKFRPKDEPLVSQANLGACEDHIQDMLDDWTKLLLNNFQDKDVQDSISLLESSQQTLVSGLLSAGEFRLPIDSRLLEAIKLLLQGIEKVEVKWDDLKTMMGNGSPMTVEDVRLRFEELLKMKVGSQQTNRVRIMLEQ